VTDALGRLSSVVEDPSGLNYQTSYSYDTLDNLTTVSQGAQTRTFSYDSLKRLTSATNPESGTIQYLYDNDGNLQQKTDARGITTTYVYDQLNRVTTRSYSDGVTPAVNYYYDTLTNGKGRLTSVSSSISTTSYGQYDAMGRVKQSTQTIDGQTYTFSNYNYNLAGGLTSETYPSGRVVTTAYDNAGRISGITGQMGTTTTPYASQFTYGAHGAVTTLQLGNGLWEHTVFNSRLQPLTIALGAVQTINNPQDYNRFRIDYSYGTTNNNGNVQYQTISVPDANGNYIAQMTQSYGYDALNRLQSMTETGGLSQTFDYDRYGNRIITGGFVQDTTHTPHHLTQSDPTISDWYDQNTNKLKTVNYDSAGNIIKDTAGTNSGNTFDYDAENKQIRYDGGSVAGGTDYKYDGDGKRVKKVVGTGQATTIFVYDVMGQMVAEYATTTPSGNGGTSYLTADSLGTPRVITDASGNVKARHDYLPFGEEVSAGVGGRTTGQGYVVDNVAQKFGGKIQDSETGLDYFGVRYYGSTLGRFISVDPGPFVPADPQSWNRYGYVQNNPLKFIDPDGRKLRLTGDSANDFLAYLEQKTGLDLEIDKKGNVTIVKGSSRNEKGTSKELAELVGKVIGDKGTASFNVSKDLGDDILVDDGGAAIEAKRKTVNVDMGDIKSIEKQAPDLAGTLVGHFLAEGLEIGKGNFNFIDDVQMLPNGKSQLVKKGAHTIGLEADSKILSGYTGHQEGIRSEMVNKFPNGGKIYQFIYASVQFDVYYKSDPANPNGTLIQVDRK
jgi:RHS repeat-associated protein